MNLVDRRQTTAPASRQRKLVIAQRIAQRKLLAVVLEKHNEASSGLAGLGRTGVVQADAQAKRYLLFPRDWALGAEHWALFTAANDSPLRRQVDLIYDDKCTYHKPL